MAILVGSTRIGKFPPMLFMTNRKTPTVVDRSFRGTISTTTANTIPNHISAANKTIVEFRGNCCIKYVSIFYGMFELGNLEHSILSRLTEEIRDS